MALFPELGLSWSACFPAWRTPCPSSLLCYGRVVGGIERLLLSGSCCYTSETLLSCFVPKHTVVETSSEDLLNNLPGASLTAARGLLGELCVLPGKARKSCVIPHGSAYWGSTPACCAALDLRWEGELLLLVLTFSKRNNNFSLGTRYSFPCNLEPAGGFDGVTRPGCRGRTDCWINISSRIESFLNTLCSLWITAGARRIPGGGCTGAKHVLCRVSQLLT